MRVRVCRLVPLRYYPTISHRLPVHISPVLEYGTCHSAVTPILSPPLSLSLSLSLSLGFLGFSVSLEITRAGGGGVRWWGNR